MTLLANKLDGAGLTSDRMRAIYYVGITQSMTRASEMLCVCQPAVTRQIQTIEDYLGFKIFEGGDRKMVITEKGDLVFQLAKRMLFDADALKKSLKETDKEMRGELKLLTFPSFGSVVIPRYLPDLQDKYPEFILNVDTPNTDLSPLEADVLIRQYIPDHPQLEQLRLYDQVVGLYAHKKYLDKYGTPQRLEDLEHHKLLAISPHFEERYPIVNWILKVGIYDGTQRRKAAYSLNSNDAVASGILNGAGIGGTSPYQAMILNNPDVVRVLPDLQSEPTPVYFIFNKQMTHKHRHMILYEHLYECLRQDLETTS